MPFPVAAAMAAGSALGGYLGSKGGDSPEQAEVPYFVAQNMRPYAQGLREFGDQYNPEFYGGQTYADQSPYTQNAITQFGQMNTQPSMDYYQNVMQGAGGLSPEFQQAVMEPAQEAAASRFGAANRLGSGYGGQAFAESGMRALAPFWNDQQNRGMQAAGAIPQLQEFQARQNLLGGGLQEQWGQKGIDESMARHEYAQELPFMKNQKWGSLYGPVTAAGGSAYMPQSTPGGSALAGAVGGGLTGLGVAQQFGWKPTWGSPGGGGGSGTSSDAMFGNPGGFGFTAGNLYNPQNQGY